MWEKNPNVENPRSQVGNENANPQARLLSVNRTGVYRGERQEQKPLSQPDCNHECIMPWVNPLLAHNTDLEVIWLVLSSTCYTCFVNAWVPTTQRSCDCIMTRGPFYFSSQHWPRGQLVGNLLNLLNMWNLNTWVLTRKVINYECIMTQVRPTPAHSTDLKVNWLVVRSSCCTCNMWMHGHRPQWL